jgi:hypothetical protein
MTGANTQLIINTSEKKGLARFGSFGFAKGLVFASGQNQKCQMRDSQNGFAEVRWGKNLNNWVGSCVG